MGKSAKRRRRLKQQQAKAASERKTTKIEELREQAQPTTELGELVQAAIKEGKPLPEQKTEPEPNPQEKIELARAEAPKKKKVVNIGHVEVPAREKADGVAVKKTAEPKAEDFQEKEDDLQVGPFTGTLGDVVLDNKGNMVGVTILAENPINGNPQIYTSPTNQLPDNFDVKPNEPVTFQLKRASNNRIIAIYVQYIQDEVLLSAAKAAEKNVNDLMDDITGVAMRYSPMMLQSLLIQYLRKHPEEIGKTTTENILAELGYILGGVDGKQKRVVLIKVE